MRRVRWSALHCYLCKRAIKIPATLARVEDYHVLGKGSPEDQGCHKMTNKWERNKRKCTANMVAITKKIICEVPFAAGSLLRAVQPLAPTVFNQEADLDTMIPEEHVRLSRGAMTEFSTLIDEMKANAAN